MRIGIPRESKDGERRVGLMPSAVAELVRLGHEVRMAAGAGSGVGASDEDYREAGASVVDPGSAWDAELVVKVKEIQPGEWRSLVPGSTLFSFQHFVGEPALACAVGDRGVTAIAFEMVRDGDGGFPLLAPMSVIAGRLAVQAGAQHLTLPGGGNGTLLSGFPGEPPARVLVLGGGHAGRHAAEVASAIGASVVVLTRSEATHDALWAHFDGRVAVGIATAETVAAEAVEADLVVGAVFVPGAPTPKLLPRPVVARMKPGSVIVDISIDAGGVAETSRPTTHADPVFVEEGVVHYCVPNMPSAVARTAATALSAALHRYVEALAGRGIPAALRDDAGLREAVLLWRGRFTHAGIAAEAGRPWAPLAEADLA